MTTTTITRETGDRWMTGESFVHTAPSGRRARRAERPGLTVFATTWSVYEIDADGEPEGKPTICETEAAAIEVADSIARGTWR